VSVAARNRRNTIRTGTGITPDTKAKQLKLEIDTCREDKTATNLKTRADHTARALAEREREKRERQAADAVPAGTGNAPDDPEAA
jgi:hypothetical protein